MKSTLTTLFASITLLLIISLGCKTIEESSNGDEPDFAERDTAAISDEDLSELQMTLAQHRSRLSDLHTSQQHDMPEAFLKKDTGEASVNSNPSDGYRVQILSTRDVELADSVANEFRMWSDTTITGYSAESYVSFNQPFYKVHIGDFQERDRANSFSKLIKPKYPEAWVVHDRIEPSNVPADSASFSFKKEIASEDSLSSN